MIGKLKNKKMNLMSFLWSISQLLSASLQSSSRSQMNSKDGENSDVMDWGGLLYKQSRSAGRHKSRWNLLILSTVIFVHAGFIGYLFSWRVAIRDNILMLDDALQVTFIDRVPTPGPEQQSSNSKNNNVAIKTRRQPARNRATDTLKDADNNAENSSPALRLSLESDEWNAEPIATLKHPLKRQFIPLAGRAEPFMHGIKLANKLSPRQKLQMVGKLFGAVDYDPCNEARNRMASGSSQINEIDLEADLRAIERHCRP